MDDILIYAITSELQGIGREILESANVMPYAVIILSMAIQKEWSNQCAAGVFAFFYSAQIFISHFANGTDTYFLWAIISTPLFLIALSMMNKITLMILLLCITEVAFLIIDVLSLIAYNLRIEWLYQMRWGPETVVITLQLAALLVRNGANIRIHQTYGNMGSSATKLVRSLLYR